MLTALDLHHNEGMTATQIGKRFGKGRGAVLGVFKRIRDDTEDTELDRNQDGTMPRKWWKAGISARKDA